MRRRQMQATGTIRNDGSLAMYMGELKEFFSMHKGKRVIASFSIVEPGTSEALRGYYFGYVVPTFRQAIWDAGERLTEEQTEKRLREMSPIMWEQEPDGLGGWHTRLRRVSELSNAELIEHIDTLKQEAAENYDCYIEDPRNI